MLLCNTVSAFSDTECTQAVLQLQRPQHRCACMCWLLQACEANLLLP
jgi:hypothetical protein